MEETPRIQMWPSENTKTEKLGNGIITELVTVDPVGGTMKARGRSLPLTNIDTNSLAALSTTARSKLGVSQLLRMWKV